MKFLIYFFAALVAVTAEYVDYSNYKVFRLKPSNDNQIFAINSLENSGQFEFWSNFARTKKYADIMVPPTKMDMFKRIVTKFQIDYDVFIEDVQKAINLTPMKDKNNKAIDWINYHPLDHINEWLEELAANNSATVSTFDAGRTYLNRTIKGIKLAFNPNVTDVAILEAGIHGREWITTAAATYIINEFITSTDPRVRAVVEGMIWYIVPVFNPDGYDYTFTTDRLWRKNVQPNNGTDCFGTDLNRNWDYMWMNPGASSNPCIEIYAGAYPGSSVEVTTLSEWIGSFGSSLKLYLDFHSYSQMIMFPYGYTYEHLENYDEMFAVAEKSALAIEQLYGKPYTYGNIAETIYIASGSSIDWVKGVLGTRFVYAYELRDTGEFGLLLPPDQIIPSSEEMLLSVVVIAEETMKVQKSS